MSHTMSIVFPDELHDRLLAAENKLFVSKSAIIRIACQKYLEDQNVVAE